MEINNIIVYFPWGAGGNFVQNVLSLAPGFQLLSETGKNVVDKNNFLLEYYSQAVTPDTWLKREWSIRTYFGNRYCLGETPAYWNPDYSLVYTTHGEERNMSGLLKDTKLKHWDRYNVDAGNITEHVCPISTHDFTHIFMIPDSVEKITRVYNSKNPKVDQLRLHDADEYLRLHQTMIINLNQSMNLYRLREELVKKDKLVLNISPDQLLTDEGYVAIIELTNNLQLDIDKDIIKRLHNLWFESTKKCYTEFYNRELNK